MNEFSTNKIKEWNAVKLSETKECKGNSTKKLKNRKVYWTWTQKVHTIKHYCPMTGRVWFTETFNGHSSDTNATSEFYLIPKKK